MNNIIIYSLIIIVGLIILKKVNLLERFFGRTENFDSIMEQNHMVHNSLKHFKSPEFPKVLEISNLPKCTYSMRYFYGKNVNYIWNNGKFVNIPILRQTTRNYIIYEDRKYKLTDIRFSPSVLTMKNKPHLLQIAFIHSDPTAKCEIHIIVPLIFSKTNNVKELEFLNKNDIPQYRGGTRDFGKVLNLQLQDIGQHLEKQTFYKYELLKNYTWLITEPKNINIELGLRLDESLKVKYRDRILNQETNFLDDDYDFY